MERGDAEGTSSNDAEASDGAELRAELTGLEEEVPAAKEG